MIKKINDKKNKYWLPQVNEIIKGILIEKKKLNWIVSPVDLTDKRFYFRPGTYIKSANEGDIIHINVSKSWLYKKSLFISGNVEKIYQK